MISKETEVKSLDEHAQFDINNDVIDKIKMSKDMRNNQNVGQNGGEGPRQNDQRDEVLDPIEQPLEGEHAQFIRQQADAGDPQAQFEYGQYLFFGNEELGIPRQPEEADRYFRMAADNNHRAGSINYAIMLINSKQPFTLRTQ